MPPPARVTKPPTELMLTIVPDRCSRIAGSSARVTASSPKTLISKSSRISCSEASSTAPIRPRPALLISTSTRPKRSSAESTAAAIDAGSVTSSAGGRAIARAVIVALPGRVRNRMKVVVTGGSGKVGRAVVRDLLEHGHEVLNVDRVAPDPSKSAAAPFLPADVTDYGQALEAVSGAEVLPGVEAVVHLAAVPSPFHATPDVTFATNIRSTHTVFSAAVRLGLTRVVWASSDTKLGLPFDPPPVYAPVDARHPLRPESSYELSK